MSIGAIKNSVVQFEHYKLLGERTFSQLEDDDLFIQACEDCNSISIIVNHIWGNMMSRWTDFLTSDGEKNWRERDLEFESVINSREEMLQKWEEGWKVLFSALVSVNPDNIDSKVLIRKQEHSILEAVQRQMMHYAYHIGQIVAIGKSIKGSAWKTLSIAKGESAKFNEEKMAQGNHKGHFTDDFK